MNLYVFYLTVLVCAFLFTALPNMLMRVPVAGNIVLQLMFAGIILLAGYLLKLPDAFATESFRMLTISPEKKCELGPYTWGPKDSPTFQFCSDPANRATIDAMTCANGFVGRPVHFNYTPESNAQWRNTRCDPDDFDDYTPEVL
jgi:hypothetical protein